MAREYYCYKWVVDRKIIYIGKTMNPRLRFVQERHQEKFKPYLDAEIWTTKLANRTEMDGVEKVLINKYQPLLNVVDKHEDSMELPFNDEDLVWEEYTAIEKEERHKCEKLRMEKEIEELQEKREQLIKDIKEDKAICELFELAQSMLLENIKSQTFNLSKDTIEPIGFTEEKTCETYSGKAMLEMIQEAEMLTDISEEDKEEAESLTLLFTTWSSRDDRLIRINITREDCVDFYYDTDDMKTLPLFKVLPLINQIIEEKNIMKEKEAEELSIEIHNKENALKKSSGDVHP